LRHPTTFTLFPYTTLFRSYPVGETNRGLACMFLLMNSARLAVGVQTVGLAETAYQNALRYANERHQGRALNGATHPSLPADPLTDRKSTRLNSSHVKISYA